MSNKGRQQIRMSTLLEKSQHMNFERLDGLTDLNYLALLTAIVDKNPKKDSRYYTKGLTDDEEAAKRMQEIDEIRAAGKMTECEKIQVKKSCDKRYKAVLNQIKRLERSRSPIRCMTKVTNKYAGTEEVFPTLKEACEKYDLKYKNVKGNFSYKKTNKIQYHGLIIEKLD